MDNHEDLVVHHATDLENQVQVLRVKKWWKFLLSVHLLVCMLRFLRLQFLVAFQQLFLYQAGGEFLSGSVAGTVCFSRAGRWCFCSNTHRGFQLSGTVNMRLSEKSWGSSIEGISSTYVLGGKFVALASLGLFFLARTKARSNRLCRFHRESAAYHPAPMRGLPLARGMMRMRTRARTSPARLFLLDSVSCECIPNPPRRLIRAKMVAVAIKAAGLMLWPVGLFTRVRGPVKRWRPTEVMPLITSGNMRVVGHH
jgi:hypothetical protein